MSVATINRLLAAEATLWPSRRLDTSVSELIDGIRDTLAQTEIEAETDRRLPRDAVDALCSAGLFKLSLPKEIGGWEADVLLELEVFEAIARISTSACWNMVVGNYHSSLAAVYCSDEAVKEIFLGTTFPVVAGQPSPIGKATLADGGMLVTGRHSWGSGINHSDWVIGGCVVEPSDGREPEQRVWVAPKRSVQVIDNWYVSGLKGTGSSDYSVENLFVADGWWFPYRGNHPLTDPKSLTTQEPKRGGNKYLITNRVWSASGHVGLCLGAAERSLEYIAGLAAHKVRRKSTTSVAAREVFRTDLATNFVLLSSTRDNAIRLFGELASLASEKKPCTLELAHQIMALLAYVAKVATAVATMAYSYAGGDSVRLDNPLQRILRDLLVAQQHIVYTDTHLERFGGLLVQRFADS